jgi:hypothetical protein
MAFENIRVQYGNFTVDAVNGSSFYTVDHITNQLIEKNSSGTVIFSYFMDVDVTEVQALQHDGVFFWTLERSGTSGFVVRKWQIGSDNLVRVQDSFSYASNSLDNFDVEAMALEWYSDSFDNSVDAADVVFDVNDGSVIQAGDTIVAGPSTAVGFTGQLGTATVTNVTNTTVTVSSSFGIDFSPNDPIYFNRSFFVFSDAAPANPDIGALYKFDSSDGRTLAVNTSNMFFGVKAATFFKQNLMFVKGGEVIWLDIDSQNIFKSQAIDNLNENRTEHHEAFDLAGFSDTIYRLELQHVYLSGGSYTTESWGEYNYNTSSTVPAVYFVAVKAEPPVIHKAVVGLTTTSRIVVQALDQFRVPVLSRPVNLSSTGGSVSPSSGTTDSDGKFVSTYTANSTAGAVEIQATVT